jgi:phenylalanyl-tRNA synthetase alpha subunit
MCANAAVACNATTLQAVHEHGGYGSSGYGYCWKRSEAQKNLLRTHTTAVSSRMLYKLAQEGFKCAACAMPAVVILA